jgi:hypothetical protein
LRTFCENAAGRCSAGTAYGNRLMKRAEQHTPEKLLVASLAFFLSSLALLPIRLVTLQDLVHQKLGRAFIGCTSIELSILKETPWSSS